MLVKFARGEKNVLVGFQLGGGPNSAYSTKNHNTSYTVPTHVIKPLERPKTNTFR